MATATIRQRRLASYRIPDGDPNAQGIRTSILNGLNDRHPAVFAVMFEDAQDGTDRIIGGALPESRIRR